MGVYLRAKFEASSIILTSFRQGLILLPAVDCDTMRDRKTAEVLDSEFDYSYWKD